MAFPSDCFDCFRLRPDRCDNHCAPRTDYWHNDPLSDEDFGPPDSDDGPDRDEYEPGGRYFEDTPSLADHPLYDYITNSRGLGY